jgi:general secretion pathway protein D
MKYPGGLPAKFLLLIAFLFSVFSPLPIKADREHRGFRHDKGHKPHLKKARELFAEGQALLDNGKFDEAQKKFEEVLEINPYHIVARKYIILIQNRKHAIEIENQAISEEARMIEVRQEWLPPEKEKIFEEVTPPWKIPVTISEARKDLEARAQQIIPAINFNNAHLSDVIKYLSKVSGINIIIDESVFEALGTEEKEVSAVTDETPNPSQETKEQMPIPSEKSDRVTIALKDVPLIEALKYILRAKGLRYVIEDYAIIIVAADYVPSEDLETRYYHLSSGVGTFTTFEQKAEGEEAPALEMEDAKITETTTIKDILEESGVPWPEGSKIFLDQRTGTLIVRNTPTNLAIVEDILRTLDVAPYQVAITARFIELENKDAEELGLEWLLNDDLKFFLHEGSNKGLTPASALQRFQFDKLTKNIDGTDITQSLTGNNRFFTSDPLTGQVTQSLIGAANPILSFSGILTRPEFSIVLHAINQKTKNNVLSSPRVTTINGQRAQIKVVQEFIYPTEYEVTPATTNSQGSVTTPPVVSPGNFETRDIGIVLDVTPQVGADRKTINLTIIPEVSEFITWLDFGVPTQTFSGSLTDPTETRVFPGFPILQPLFASRTVTTSVIVNDGETVVLGGLIRDEVDAYNDKIPILGDIPGIGLLFRKKGEISIKKNLVIFVTAELLTPSGDPYAPTKIEPGQTLVPIENTQPVLSPEEHPRSTLSKNE